MSNRRFFSVLCLPGLILFGLILATSSMPLHAAVNASVSATEITTDQTLTLDLVSNSAKGAPNLQLLQTDFDILDQSQQSQIQTINGNMQQTRRWSIELRPKRTGVVVVPGLTINGETTQPIRIRVDAAKPIDPDGDFGNFKVEVGVDNETPYVQSQVVFTITVFFALNLLEGNLSSPETESIVLERLGEDKEYRENRNGRQYRVLERKFAVFPQKSGKIFLPEIVLNAKVPADGAQSRGIWRPTKRIRSRSESLTLDVLPRPPDSGNNWWLPASMVTLDGRWEGDVSEVRVGDSLTRSVTLIAEGVDSTQLPEIEVPKGSMFKVYADQPNLGRQPGSNGLQSSREEKWAIVTQQAGVLVLPEIRVPWFNTATQAEEVAVLPAASIEILPAASTPQDNTLVPQTEPSVTPGSTEESQGTEDNTSELLTPALLNNESDAVPAGNHVWWQWLAFAALAGWIITSAFLIRQVRKGRSGNPGINAVMSQDANRADSLSDIRKACRSGDMKKSAAAIVTWARHYWPENPPGTLVAVAARVESPGLAQDLKALDSALYANQSSPVASPVALETLAEKLSQAIVTPMRKGTSGRGVDLPEL